MVAKKKDENIIVDAGTGNEGVVVPVADDNTPAAGDTPVPDGAASGVEAIHANEGDLFVMIDGEFVLATEEEINGGVLALYGRNEAGEFVQLPPPPTVEVDVADKDSVHAEFPVAPVLTEEEIKAAEESRQEHIKSRVAALAERISALVETEGTATLDTLEHQLLMMEQ